MYPDEQDRRDSQSNIGTPDGPKIHRWLDGIDCWIGDPPGLTGRRELAERRPLIGDA